MLPTRVVTILTETIRTLVLNPKLKTLLPPRIAMPPWPSTKTNGGCEYPPVGYRIPVFSSLFAFIIQSHFDYVLQQQARFLYAQLDSLIKLLDDPQSEHLATMEK